MRLIERYGSGISRILDGCQEAGLPKPLFENFSGGFRIKFMSTTPVTGEVTGDEEMNRNSRTVEQPNSRATKVRRLRGQCRVGEGSVVVGLGVTCWR